MKCEGELINMTRAWDKEKFWVPDRNRTHDLHDLRPPGVREVMGSIPVGDSEFVFVPRSCHVD